MTLHDSTFEYHKPEEREINLMAQARAAAKAYADAIEAIMPEGPDKTYVLRKLREVAMWVNVGIDRLPDGRPRS